MSSVTVDTHAEDHAHDAHSGGFLSTYVFSLDHKIIGMQFLFSTLIWFLIGGLLALGIRWQLAYPWKPMPILGEMLAAPEGGQIAPENYTMLVTMHATVMIFFVIIPVLAGAFGNFLIPLMIGADDMAVPTLNMLSYWFMWPAFYRAWEWSFFVEGGAAQGGWTSYPPLSVLTEAAPGSHNGQTLWLIGRHICRCISSMMGSVNYMTTIIQMRAPGMTMFRLPLTIWAMFITAILQAFALPGPHGSWLHATARPLGRHRLLFSRGSNGQQFAHGSRWWSTAALAALVLVLQPSGRIHHDPPRNGHGV